MLFCGLDVMVVLLQVVCNVDFIVVSCFMLFMTFMFFLCLVLCCFVMLMVFVFFGLILFLTFMSLLFLVSCCF